MCHEFLYCLEFQYSVQNYVPRLSIPYFMKGMTFNYFDYVVEQGAAVVLISDSYVEPMVYKNTIHINCKISKLNEFFIGIFSHVGILGTQKVPWISFCLRRGRSTPALVKRPREYWTLDGETFVLYILQTPPPPFISSVLYWQEILYYQVLLLPHSAEIKVAEQMQIPLKQVYLCLLV